MNWEQMLKIYIDPNPGKRQDRADGGIRRVLDAQIKCLPEFGIRVTRKIEDADLTVGHVDHAPIAEGKPFINHNHGLMWDCYFKEPYNQEVNANVTKALCQADAITVPSRWVANAIGYGLLRTPHVIYHGVDVEEWQPPTEPGKYVLWNKARADAVSNPQDMQTLASRMPNAQFVSTLGTATSNVKLCGVVNYPKMKSLVQGAGVYLATARETFGIGTLEALACGVPVAGWDYGGQSEIIIQGETGYLAPFGNYDALAECVGRCFAEREKLSVHARADVLKRWQWRDKIEQYANLYKETLARWTDPRPKVSVIVTCHNLAKYLPDALNSVERQTIKDWECLIVDDASADNTPNVGNEFAKLDGRFQYLRTPENLKLSRALNFGHARARGRYVMNLDADNVLPENALEILSDALDKRRDLHVVYGALDTMSDDGSNRQHNAFPYPVYENFSWNAQLAHLNQLHSSAMMRREVIEQSGGYRERQWRAEDAEFWSRVSSFGFKIERVTDQPTLVYRWRSGSKSMIESQQNPDRDGDWCEYFPWRTAKNAEDGKKQIATNPNAVANTHLVPFGAQGKRTDGVFWNVYHRQDPLVSVIIPVGPGHLRYLPDALDSLVGQTTNEWEAIIVNDTGDDWTSVVGAPYARVFKTTGKQGAGAARNVGLKYAKGRLVFFLDADDMLHPDALVKFVQRYARGDAGYIYCDALVPESPTKNRTHTAPEFTQDGWLKRGLHSQGILMATDDARRIGGFNETMQAWEDWDFFVKCVVNGICGERLGEPLLLYRKHLGQRSALGNEKRPELYKELQERYKDYLDGSKQMTKCGGCGSKKVMESIARSRVMETKVTTLEKPVPPGHVRLKYTGAKFAPVNYYANGHPYTACAAPKWRFLDVPEKDAAVLLGMPVFERVRTAPVVLVSPPVAEPVKEVAPVVVAPITQPIPEPKPAPAVKPVVSAAAMQAAVAALEEKTGKSIQPQAETVAPTVAQTPTIEITMSAPKRKGKRK